MKTATLKERSPAGTTKPPLAKASAPAMGASYATEPRGRSAAMADGGRRAPRAGRAHVRARVASGPAARGLAGRPHACAPAPLRWTRLRRAGGARARVSMWAAEVARGRRAATAGAHARGQAGGRGHARAAGHNAHVRERGRRAATRTHALRWRRHGRRAAVRARAAGGRKPGGRGAGAPASGGPHTCMAQGGARARANGLARPAALEASRARYGGFGASNRLLGSMAEVASRGGGPPDPPAGLRPGRRIECAPPARCPNRRQTARPPSSHPSRPIAP